MQLCKHRKDVQIARGRRALHVVSDAYGRGTMEATNIQIPMGRNAFSEEAMGPNGYVMGLV
jgi:uncharacterized protein (DUF2141 family)